MRNEKKDQGTVLILVLWALGFLATFVIILGAIVRQKIDLIARFEAESRLHYLAEAGIKKTLVLLAAQNQGEGGLSSKRKLLYCNNPSYFKEIKLDKGSVEVSYALFDDRMEKVGTRYGVVDEEGKININKADREVLKRILQSAAKLEGDEAQELASAIVDWRGHGEGETAGFYSDEYYDNLEYPYLKKGEPFEVIEELLLIKGMNEAIFKKILPFVTVYGGGKININTAPRVVLLALGLSENLANKILFIRRGQDQREATEDDYWIGSIPDFKSDVVRFFELNSEENTEIDSLISSGQYDTQSYYYRIEGKASLGGRGKVNIVECVFDTQDGRIKYWQEGMRNES